MPVLRIEVDEELKQQMDRHPAVNWDQIVKQAIRERISQLEEWNGLTEESQLTQDEVDELAELIDRGASKRASQQDCEDQ